MLGRRRDGAHPAHAFEFAQAWWLPGERARTSVENRWPTRRGNAFAALHRIRLCRHSAAMMRWPSSRSGASACRVVVKPGRIGCRPAQMNQGSRIGKACASPTRCRGRTRLVESTSTGASKVVPRAASGRVAGRRNGRRKGCGKAAESG